MKVKPLRLLMCFTLTGVLSFMTFMPVNAQAKDKLPPGLAKRYELPPGLAKRDKLPPGLQKRLNKVEEDPVEKLVKEEAMKEEPGDEKSVESPTKEKTEDKEIINEKTIIQVIKEKPTEEKNPVEEDTAVVTQKEPIDRKVEEANKTLYLKLQTIYEKLFISFNELLQLLEQLG